MPRIITGLAPTTELEAINEMLSTIGESPVLQAEIESPTLADVVRAVAILRNTAREILSMRWRFNMDFGFEVSPDAETYIWTGSDGSSETLNVFQVPSNVVYWKASEIPDQTGSTVVDAVERPATDAGAAQIAAITAGDLIIYDRQKNREGWNADDFPYLYLDIAWFLDFADCPEAYRRYVTVKAARRFQAQTVGAQELDGFTDRDERMAYRTLRQEQGLRDFYNIFNGAEAMRHRGFPYRTPGATGLLKDRSSPYRA